MLSAQTYDQGPGGARLNTSSLVALFAPQFGLQSIKHGGRSSTGKVGSNDFIESLGISLKNMFHFAPEYFRATGVLFLAAAYTYPVFAKSAPLRKQLAHPTLFNLLGPLLNPVSVRGKLIGAYNSETALLMAKTCQLLNENAVVVTAQDKNGFLDEASPFGVTTLHICKNKILTTTALEPIEELSRPLSDIFQDNMKVTSDLLSFKKSDETEVAKKLIAYNLAVLCCLHVPGEVKKLYELILSNFDIHLEKVNERISILANFQPLHERSPIHDI